MKERRKGRSEQEHVEAENKKLRKENERLKKQMVKLEQKAGRLDSIEDDYKELLQTKPQDEKKELCERCGEPGIKYSDIPIGKLGICKFCKATKLIRKPKEGNDN